MMGLFFMSDISTTELLESNNDSLQKKLHTSLPARVVSYSGNQTVTIELMIQQMDYEGKALDLPPLVDVPVQMFSYGNFRITAEPKAGDEGLAHFSERCIDGWWDSSQKSVPLDVRFHDLSDAFFAGGYKSKPKSLQIIPDAMHIGSNSAYIRIFDNGTIELVGTAFNVNAPTTFSQPVSYQSGMSGQGGIDIQGNVKTDGDLIASGKSFLSHTNGGEAMD